MKLAFALFTYFPHGGVTRDLISVVQACQKCGYQVRVYAAECRGSVEADIDLHVLTAKGYTNHSKNQEFAKQFGNAVMEFLPDLIIGFNKMPGLDVYYAADICFAQKVCHRSWLYRITPRCRHYLDFENEVFSKVFSTQILMIAKNQIAVYQKFYGTPQGRMFLLPPGIACNRVLSDDLPIRRRKHRSQWQLDKDDKLMLAIGSGFCTKGLDRTLKAVASLPVHLRDRSYLFVLGDDNATPFIKKARRLGIDSRVKFLNGRDDIPEFLLAADMLVHPAYWENTGTVLLEAMVAGLPVITTDVCGYAHYVRDEGMGEVLESPFSQTALNLGIQRLMEIEREIWWERGRNFAQRADIYDMPLHACRYIEKIVARKNG